MDIIELLFIFLVGAFMVWFIWLPKQISRGGGKGGYDNLKNSDKQLLRQYEGVLPLDELKFIKEAFIYGNDHTRDVIRAILDLPLDEINKDAYLKRMYEEIPKLSSIKNRLCTEV